MTYLSNLFVMLMLCGTGTCLMISKPACKGGYEEVFDVTVKYVESKADFVQTVKLSPIRSGAATTNISAV